MCITVVGFSAATLAGDKQAKILIQEIAKASFPVWEILCHNLESSF